MSITFTEGTRVPPDVLVRELDGESVILNLNTERYFGLNEMGTRMWSALTQSTSIQAAYETLLTEYDVDADLLRQDLQHLVEQLIEHGLVEIHS
ncbi:hypothetical protein BST81_25010 [Leptolyngbya sp. 'hensonii']|nr:hypothetical protein BST81_25010 [Leptolyngbya sp. 'hensonii']